MAHVLHAARVITVPRVQPAVNSVPTNRPIHIIPATPPAIPVRGPVTVDITKIPLARGATRIAARPRHVPHWAANGPAHITNVPATRARHVTKPVPSLVHVQLVRTAHHPAPPVKHTMATKAHVMPQHLHVPSTVANPADIKTVTPARHAAVLATAHTPNLRPTIRPAVAAVINPVPKHVLGPQNRPMPHP